jgi:hypothetical protein
MLALDLASGSELFRQSGLFQDGVGQMPRENGIVDHEARLGDRTFLNLVIALALSNKTATGFAQDLFNSGVKLFMQWRGHAPLRRSRWEELCRCSGGLGSSPVA